jgi:hypothetical protein
MDNRKEPSMDTLKGPSMLGPETFDYTRRDFWGGPWYPYWTLVTITALGGFFGLDHFWLRSPTTGAIKCIVNILTLGLWWVYDMVQVFAEKDSVMKHGLSVPLAGPLGIGAGMFMDNQPDATPSRSPLRWMAYLLLMLTPFGFDSLVGGDSNGAFAKLLSVLFPLMWPISFAWFFANIWYTVATPKKLFTEGLLRFFPFSLLWDAKGPSILGPKDLPDRPDGCDPGGSKGFFRGIFDAILVFLNIVLPPIIVTAINSAFPGLIPAVQAGSAAVQAGATTVKTGFNVATGVIEAVRDPATVTAATGSKLIQSIPGAVESAGKAVGNISSGLEKMASPEALKMAASGAGGSSGPGDGAASGLLNTAKGSLGALGSLGSVKDSFTTKEGSAKLGGLAGSLAGKIASATTQSGGAMLLGATVASQSGNSDFTNSAILALLLVILAGGTWFAAKRLNLVELIIPKRNDDGQQRDDTPPRPRDV